jgi:hypothetical protein
MRVFSTRSSDSPKTVILPESGNRIRINMRMVVVLPAPFGPSNPAIVPDGIENDILSTAVIPSYAFTIPSTSTTLPLAIHQPTASLPPAPI